MARVILIAGATSSGKSALANLIATARDGVVINADSMQVYRELRILTARPSQADEAAIPHRLYGHVSAAQAYSVGLWLKDVACELNAVRGAGKLPVLVGGTGLYFKALTEGLSPVPPIDAGVRERWRARAEAVSAQELFDELQSRDALTAGQLRVSDRQRVVRALEVIESTGRALADWQKIPGTPVLGADEWTGVVVERPREEIYRRCDERFDQMLAEGALDEVDVLRQMQLDPRLPAMRALGVGPLLGCLQQGREAKGLVDAVEQSKMETRRFVKRQLTWQRRNMIAWKSILTKDIESIGAQGFPFIEC